MVDFTSVLVSIFGLIMAVIGFFSRDAYLTIKNRLNAHSQKIDTLEDVVTEAKANINSLEKQVDEEKRRLQILEKFVRDKTTENGKIK